MTGGLIARAARLVPAGQGDLVVVADAHLTEGDPDVDAFCAFLGEAARDAAGLVLLGDIFALWLGAEKLTRAHQGAVLRACSAVRARGTPVAFVEGNRELGVTRGIAGAFDACSDVAVLADHAGRRWCFAHGDLVRAGGLAERLFRALVRSRVVQRAFFALPARVGLALADRIESRLRARNLRAKTAIHPESLEAFARTLADEGIDAAAIGHLHVEMTAGSGASPAAHVLVLPDWRSERRYLRIPAGGEPRFVTWGRGRAPRPAIVSVTERGREADVRLDRASALTEGDAVVVSSGHGPDVRRGVVVRCPEAADGAGGAERVVLRLEPGAPLQAGDRVERGGPGDADREASP